VFPSILQRAIFRELVRTFFAALVVCIAVLMAVDMFDERWQSCVDTTSFLRCVHWLGLAMLPEAVPTALLFATCQVYGRLRRDQEWLALQAGGAHYLHAIMPAFFLGSLLSVGVAVLVFDLLPSAEYLARKAVILQGESLVLAKLNTKGRAVLPPYTIYVSRLNGEEMVDPVIKRTAKDGKYDLILHARKAKMRIGTERGVVRMEVASMVDAGSQGTFEEVMCEVALPMNYMNYFPDTTSQMTLDQIQARREELLRCEAEAANGTPTAGQPPSDDKMETIHRQLGWLGVEIQKRPAIAVACLCFTLIGCAGGLWAGFGDTLSAFVASFLPIFAVHHTLLLCGIHWTVRNGFPAEITLWCPNVLVGVVGAVLFWRVARR
jgi:lipopolysaccharide export system permease protein